MQTVMLLILVTTMMCDISGLYFDADSDFEILDAFRVAAAAAAAV